MPKTREDFVPDVGAFLDNVDGDIVEAVFDIASGDYADKVMMGGGGTQPPVVLRLTIESPELDRPAVQSYSVGSQDVWEILDNGKAIQNIKNPDRHLFRKGSIGWALVEAIMTSIGEGNLEKGQDYFIKRDKYMTQADFYTGLSFHWATKALTFNIGGRTFTSNPPLPETYLGEAKPTTKEKADTTVTVVEDETLDAIIIGAAPDKNGRELKSFAVRSPDIKKNDAYMKAIVSGKKLRQLEEAGLLTRDPDTQKYI